MPKQYVYEWFMTLFTRALKVELVSRVLDLYFLDGIFVLYQTAIGKSRTILISHPILPPILTFYSYFENFGETHAKRGFRGHYDDFEESARFRQGGRTARYLHI